MAYPSDIRSLDDVFLAFEERTNFEKGWGKLQIEREYRLDRMMRLCKAFDDPQNAYQVIHVAGSKGKGSTAACIGRLISQSDCKVGIYSSPHMTDYRERFSVPTAPFPEEEAFRCAKRVLEKVISLENAAQTQDDRATTFELLTLFAFVLFREIGCHVLVLECGIGGRLDATNIVPSPMAVVITPIEKEHTEILGRSLSEIAGEKAGIIKPGTRVWTAAQKPTVLKVLRKTCLKCKVPLHEISHSLKGVDNIQGIQQWRLHWKNRLPDEIQLCMGGRVQADNAALALDVVRWLAAHSSFDRAFPVDPKVLKDVCLAGRFEIIKSSPPIVFDGAHTLQSVKGTLEAFFRLLDPFRRPHSAEPTLIFACAMDKNHRKMAEMIGRYRFGRIIITRPGYFKPCDPDVVARSFERAGADVQVIEHPKDAWKKAIEDIDGGILVTGSFYVAGILRKEQGFNPRED